jgi:hypothetical protein
MKEMNMNERFLTWITNQRNPWIYGYQNDNISANCFLIANLTVYTHPNTSKLKSVGIKGLRAVVFGGRHSHNRQKANR